MVAGDVFKGGWIRTPSLFSTERLKLSLFRKEASNNRRKGSAFGISCFTTALAMLYHCYGTIGLNRKIQLMLKKNLKARVNIEHCHLACFYSKIHGAL